MIMTLNFHNQASLFQAIAYLKARNKVTFIGVVHISHMLLEARFQSE